MSLAAIDRLAATPRDIAHLVVEATDAVLDATPQEGWSARIVIAHLRDDEYLCMRVALERMLAEDGPELTFLEGDGWGPGRNTSRDRKELLLADFALQRQASLNILQSLRPGDWDRQGHTAGGQAFTLRAFVESWADHDREHLAQLEALIGETVDDARSRRAHTAADHAPIQSRDQ